jgi:hypothetical protein
VKVFEFSLHHKWRGKYAAKTKPRRKNEMLKAPKHLSKQYEIANEGEHVAVLGAVQDLGLVYNAKFDKECQRVRFVWLVGDETEAETGNPLLVFQSMNLKLTRSPMSKLFETLLDATGKPPDPDMDLEKLVGLQARIVVVHRQGDNREYANVDRVLPPAPEQNVEIPISWWAPKVYRRNSENGPGLELSPRKPAPAKKLQLEIPGGFTQPQISDDDIPF